MKERILERAGELYFTLGFRSVTMDDIAADLGISKKTIYQHFSDKNELVEAVSIHFLKRHENRQTDCCRAGGNPLEEMIATTRRMRELLTNLNPAIFHDLQKYYPKALQHYLNHKEKYKEVLVENITEGIKQGYYRKEIDPLTMARLRAVSVDMAFDPSVFPTSELPLVEIQLMLIDHFIRGIVTEKGLAAYEEIK